MHADVEQALRAAVSLAREPRRVAECARPTTSFSSSSAPGVFGVFASATRAEESDPMGKRVFGIALDQPKKILRWLETEGLTLTPEFRTRAGVHVLIDDERLDNFQLSSTATR
jgi:hypothetical protein